MTANQNKQDSQKYIIGQRVRILAEVGDPPHTVFARPGDIVVITMIAQVGEYPLAVSHAEHQRGTFSVSLNEIEAISDNQN